MPKFKRLMQKLALTKTFYHHKTTDYSCKFHFFHATKRVKTDNKSNNIGKFKISKKEKILLKKQFFKLAAFYISFAMVFSPINTEAEEDGFSPLK
ncbi:hypothetical protein [Neobacillus sp.]|uniref:hypothetical protein n=1 Tax=Neobacillus sp. TaxID=2675273 RepID=UPI00289E3A04|nr:hypothetical protein [Neobacillus sp.]